MSFKKMAGTARKLQIDEEGDHHESAQKGGEEDGKVKSMEVVVPSVKAHSGAHLLWER